MTKRNITIWWLAGMGAMVVGGLLALFTGLGLASHIGALAANYQFTNYVPDGTFWVLISFIILGCIAVLGGIVVQLVAWIGAVINTHRLVDKMWYNIMLSWGIAAIVLTLFTGLVGALFGWVLMIVYLIGAPDSMVREPRLLQPVPAEAPRTLSPTG